MISRWFGLRLAFAIAVFLAFGSAGSAETQKTEIVKELSFKTGFVMKMREPQFVIQIPVDVDRGPTPVTRPDLTRLNTCQAAVERIRPTLGSELDYSHLDEYVQACFSKLSDLPPSLAGMFRSNLATLTLPNGGHCTALVVARKVALTARHCFFPPRTPVGLPIQAGDLKSVLIQGLTDTPPGWKVTGVKVIGDPFEAKSPLLRQLYVSRGSNPNALDFVALAPLDGVAEFHAPQNITATLPAGRFITAGTTQLVVGSFFSTKTGIVVDKLSTCRVVEYRPERGYLKHRCQTVPGSSGAPVFVFSDDAPFVMLGLHVGPEGTVSRGVPVVLENEAVLIPAELVQELRKLDAGISELRP